MFSKYFGLYLLSKGLLTKAQFFDITQTHIANTSSEDEFPEVATFSADFQEIYEDAISAKQIVSAILSKKLLDFPQMQQAIAEYEKECQVIEKQEPGFKGLDYEIIARILLDGSIITNKKLQDIFYIYVAILLANIVKYLSDEPAIWTNYLIEEGLPKIAGDKAWMVSQSVTIKDTPIKVSLFMHADMLLSLARRYSQEPATAVNALVLDAVSEFFNFNNGQFVTNLTNAGITAETGLPKVEQDISVPLKNGYIVPIGLQEGQMYLILSA